MGHRVFCLLLFVGIINSTSFASDLGGRRNASVHVPESSLYAYLNQAGGWCALKKRTTFMAEVNSDTASQLEVDQAQVWLNGKMVNKITEFRMDADGEWSTTSTYKFDESGIVVSVNVVVRSGEPATDKSFKFTVIKGGYSPDTPSFLSPKTFRKAILVSSFPYWSLVERLSRDKAAQKLCN